MSGNATKGNNEATRGGIEATKCQVMVRKAMGDGRLDDMQKQDNATKNGKSNGQDGIFILISVFLYFCIFEDAATIVEY